MSLLNVDLNTFTLNTVGVLTANINTLSTDNAFINTLNTKIDTVGAFSASSTAAGLSLASNVITAHASNGSNYGMIKGITALNTALGDNTLGNVTGTGNIAIGNGIGAIITSGTNNIVIGGAVDSATAINRIVFGGTNSIDNSLMINSTRFVFSGLGSSSSTTFMAYNAGNIGPSTLPVLLTTGGTMTGDLLMGGNIITNAGMPTADDHGATVGYVTSVSAGLDPKESCTYVTLSNITTFAVKLTVEATLDLVGAVAPVLVVGDRVLVKDQIDDKLNGIYWWNVAGTALERAPDQDGTPASEVSGGNFTFIENGDTLATTGWVLQGDGILTLGVDSLVWVAFTAISNVAGNNVGGGVGIFKQRVGNTLESRSLIGTVGVGLVSNLNDITISNTLTISSAGGTTLINTGAGNALAFKGLSAGSNITITANANDLLIDSSAAVGPPKIAIIDNTYNVLFPVPISYEGINQMALSNILYDDIGLTLLNNEITLPIGDYTMELMFEMAGENQYMAITILDDTNNFIASSFTSDSQSGTRVNRIARNLFNFSLPASTTIKIMHVMDTFSTLAVYPEPELAWLVDPAAETEVTFDLNTLTNIGTLGVNNGCKASFARNNNWLAVTMVNVSNNVVIAIFDYTLTKLAETTITATTPNIPRIMWGFNNDTTLFVCSEGDIRAYSFNGVTLTLVNTLLAGNVIYSIDIRSIVGADEHIVICRGRFIRIIKYVAGVLSDAANNANASVVLVTMATWASNSNTIFSYNSENARTYLWNDPTLTAPGNILTGTNDDPRSIMFAAGNEYAHVTTDDGGNNRYLTYSVPPAANAVLSHNSSTGGNVYESGMTWDYTRSFMVYRSINGISYRSIQLVTTIIGSIVGAVKAVTWNADTTNTLSTHPRTSKLAYITSTDGLLRLTASHYYTSTIENGGVQATTSQISIRKIA